MEQRVTTYSEYSISSNVGDIRNVFREANGNFLNWLASFLLFRA